MQQAQIKYQAYLSLNEHSEDAPHKGESCLTLDSETNVVSLKQTQKVFKTKFEGVGAPYDIEQFYQQVKPSLEHSFANGSNLAVVTKGFHLSGETILFGNYNTPGNGLLDQFVNAIPSLIKEGDSVKFSYINIYLGSAYDYFKDGEKDGDLYSPIKFGLIENERTFKEVTEIDFETPEQTSAKLNEVKPYWSQKATMGGYSRECIPIVRFVITRGETSFSVEFYAIPNSTSIAKTCPSQQTLKECTFINNCIQSYTNVLRALAQKNKMVPYRDSLLTKMLKPFFAPAGGNIVSLAHLMNDHNYSDLILETLVLNKFLRRINKAQGLPTTTVQTEGQPEAQPSVVEDKSENFFTKHPKFQDMKLQAQALLTKAQCINDRINDFETGNFQEGGMAYEGLDMPISNLLRNAQNVADVSTEIKNEYYSELMSQQKEFCESED